MSRREKQRRDLLYDDPVDCGVVTASKVRKAPDETRTVSEVHRTPVPIGAYGLFAGHGGVTAADLCARNFVPTLMEDSALERDPEASIRNACQALEAFVTAKSALDRSYYGTTMLFAMVKGQNLLVANIGNSRAVLATKDGVQTITQEHDGSNAEEVARVRNAGGFFQDGKVNNLIRVTRSIGDSELKDRKHITFPGRKMAEDIVIAVPDIYCRKLTPQDDFLVMATAQVWENLSNKVVVQIISDSLRRGETSRTSAKKVASAALHAGARGPLTVMVLIFPQADLSRDKPTSPPRRRTSRPSTLKRHSSNAEQELRSVKSSAKTNNTPAFVLAAQAQEEQRRAIQEAQVPSSPIASPASQVIRSSANHEIHGITQSTTTSSGSTTFLSLNVPPATEGQMSRRTRTEDGNHGALIQQGSKTRGARSHSVMGTEGPAYGAGPKDVEIAPRKQIEFDRGMHTGTPPIEQREYVDRQQHVSPRAKTLVVSRISELTASGATGVANSSYASLAEEESTVDDFNEYSQSGPSKVRYRDDGTVYSSRLAFLKDLGRTFVRRR